ncbi:MAG: GGDEF domain-containing protein [Desulfobulbaceae bacterium]|nr:GGDEF domain-containing protein [Desulfobulbaceae bacterium]HIJ77948.1 GGDEF domain-containing protein [Deltaproteobacteria bacterium]
MFFLRKLVNFFWPGGVLLALAIAALQFDDSAQLIMEFTWAFPFIVGGVALFLGWRFNRSRLLFAVLVLLMAQQLLLYFGGGDDGEQLAVRYVSFCITVLLPFDFILFAMWRERGMFTVRGLCRLALLAGQPFMAAALYRWRGPLIVQELEQLAPPLTMADFDLLTYPALALYGLGLLLLVIRYGKGRDHLDLGLFWALLISLAALVMVEPGLELSFYFSVAGFILIAAGLESAHSMAFIDELTGLPARRALNEALMKLGGRYCVAMLDIDFFKKFNDRYGHDVGDQVLGMVAAKLRQVGGGGCAFRYGGEEFTILFSGKSAQQAQPYLEKLRKTIAASGFKIRGSGRPKRKPPKGGGKGGSRKQVSVTISIGLADHNGGRDTPFTVIKAADKALYRAKNGGRNQVSL